MQDTSRQKLQKQLLEKDVKQNPLTQFQIWLDELLEKRTDEQTAMILSTVDRENRPHARVVFLKELTIHGFMFFTNYNSAKAEHISANQFVSLTFFWPELERQVRVDGNVTKLSHMLSDEYFASRPVGSQLGAWASPQSQVISSRSMLDDNFNMYKEKFGDKIPRPQYWGGYLVKPYQIEFWQGRPNRLHDRICYRLDRNEWRIMRLAP